MHKGLYWTQLLTGIGIGLIIASLIWIFYPQFAPQGEIQEVMPEREIVYYNTSAFDLGVPKLLVPDGEEKYAEIIDESELLLVYSSDYFKQSSSVSPEVDDTVAQVDEEVSSITTELNPDLSEMRVELTAQILDSLNLATKPDLKVQKSLDGLLKAEYALLPTDITEINVLTNLSPMDNNQILSLKRTEDIQGKILSSIVNTQITLNPETSISESDDQASEDSKQEVNSLITDGTQEIASSPELSVDPAEEVDSQPVSEVLLAEDLENNSELNPSLEGVESPDIFDTDLTLAPEELPDEEVALALDDATSEKTTSEETVQISDQNQFEDSLLVEQSNLDTSTEELADLTEQTADHKEVEFIIEPGDSAEKIARNLKKSGIIKDEEEFLRVVRNKRLDRKLRAGGYLLMKNMSLTDLVNELIK